MPSNPSESRWYVCRTCDDYLVTLAFYTPDAVYCEGCDQQVGTTDRPVESPRAALAGDRIIDSETGDRLAGVEWDDDRLEIREGDDAE